MLASMYSAVAGLSVHQTKMDVIGNNIANVNTYGFKSSRVCFSDVFYQNFAGASAPTATTGGTNASQKGYGSTVATIDVISTRGGSATTDRSLDVYINGDGYLPVQDSSGNTLYTRLGNLYFDVEGNLVDGNGNKILGLPMDENGVVQLEEDGTAAITDLSAIIVEPERLEKLTSISIGNDGKITAIEEGARQVTLTAGTNWIDNAAIKEDSNYSGALKITKVTETGISFYSDAALPAGVTVDVSALNDPGFTADKLPKGEMTFEAGKLKYTYKDEANGTYSTETVTADPAGGVEDTGAGNTTFTYKIAGTGGATQNIIVVVPTTSIGETITLGKAAPKTVDFEAQVYNKAGIAQTLTDTWTAGGADNQLAFGEITLELNSTEMEKITDFGKMEGKQIGNVGAGDGTVESIGQLALATFINVDGLAQEGEGYYSLTANSGNATIVVPGSNGSGSLVSSALEMSNVDLAAEFTEMIFAQRGFQANSRVITTSDTLLEELINLKR